MRIDVNNLYMLFVVEEENVLKLCLLRHNNQYLSVSKNDDTMSKYALILTSHTNAVFYVYNVNC